ncbi:TPA: hypothetical protein DCP13_02805 [Candidatus Azambacteria bacterium]|uniref:Tudor domain-containing protein n=3 Tax=Candidatus Azamiibacteriota TaxID=1752741 RepID=A0A0G1T3M3_9BACT|nr:MAG: hypothetical protein UX33_C0046G0001 [Candidatus Azambacteria bacterium GW2011_GWC1_46_13]KKU34745.1 MAG: hypothetical protein UX48_C0026G0009 [Candidatus Azambacteria bacterium GW2011_GWB1_46_27]KKU40035.1 MAG: hypothetical protein UX55_C0017G0007 [Candidatus Azambacteria bacterium GW2011_GWE2_46_45]HAQ05702.1 hypothetical protein [Candidatus Azambacteria bacterium]HBA52623.1 hypothetical protein [Candidatus Azambacteria bacterium]
MEPTNRKIQALVDMFLVQELLLPEMQRKYVWRATQVRDLIDSIYRDYPSGSILIWETDNLPEVKTHAFEKTSQLPIGKRLLLLDGQQRVTSLASILTGHPVRIKEGTKIKEKFVDIYFNIDHPEEGAAEIKETARFEVSDFVEAKREDGEFYTGKISAVDNKRYYIIYDDGDEGWSDEVRDLGEEGKKELYFQIKNKKIENKPNWISVTKLFKDGVGSILRSLKIGADHPNFDKYNERLNQLYSRKESYLYPIQIIRDKEYNEVTEIFIRVNTSGTRLRSSDLALAQITSAWPGSMKLFEEFVDQCIKKDFYLDENFFVRCLICIATVQAKFDNTNRMSLDKLKDSWELTKKGVQNTINFLKNNAFVDSSALLPSPILLVPLVYYSSKEDLCVTPEIEKGFLYWFYNAAIWGRYSASMETRLTQDLMAFSNKKPWITLIDNIWQLVGKDRKITPEDIRGKSISNPLFFIMYVLARKNDARDLETGGIINYTNFGTNNKIEFDHIFPKSKLESFFKNKLDNSERKKIINELANIAFMTKKGNIIKTNDDPSTYFPKVHSKYNGKDYFERQQIPYDRSLLSYEKYQEFLNKRAVVLTEKITEFLDGLK